MSHFFEVRIFNLFEYLLCGCARRMFQNKQITDNQTLLQTLALIYFNFLGAFSKLRKSTIRFIMSVRLSAWNNPTPTRRIFMKFDIRLFFEKLSWKLKFY
jgi:hypothetical protein